MKLIARTSVVKKLSALALAAALGCALASPAPAATLNFYYTFPDSKILSATLSGAVSGHYFTVTGVTALAVDGVSQAGFLATAAVYSADSFVGLGGGHNGDNTPVVTDDGSYLDILFTDPSGNRGFDFFVNDVDGNKYGNYTAYEIDGAGSDMATYTPSSYYAAVPEAATWAMMLIGMAAIGLAMRRGGHWLQV